MADHALPDVPYRSHRTVTHVAHLVVHQCMLHCASSSIEDEQFIAVATELLDPLLFLRTFLCAWRQQSDANHRHTLLHENRRAQLIVNGHVLARVALAAATLSLRLLPSNNSCHLLSWSKLPRVAQFMSPPLVTTRAQAAASSTTVHLDIGSWITIHEHGR